MEWHIVIGASILHTGKGIGRAITLKLSDTSNVNILAVARTASTSLQGISPKIIPFDLDISNPDNFNSINEYIGEGKIKTLVFTAVSTGSYSRYPQSSYQEFEQHMKIEVAAPFFIIKSLDSNFENGARILYAFSLCSVEYCLPLPIYSMARAAYFMLFKALRKELPNLYITGVL